MECKEKEYNYKGFFIATRFGTSFSYLAAMTTYYFKKQEDALRKAKQAGKQPNATFNGMTMPDGRKGFDVYRKGTLVERYLVIKPKKR